LRDTSFELVDDEGNVKATLTVGPDGDGLLALRDAAGAVRVLVRPGSIDLIDPQGNQRVEVMESGPGGLAVWDENGRHRILVGHGPAPDRDASIELWDSDGHYRVGLGVWPDGSTGVELLDDRGNVRGRLGERPDRTVCVEEWDREGQLRARFGDRPDGSFTVDFWDRDGTYRHGLGSQPD
jgi:hypothetical protein